jgi:3-deoxy-D-manno-octulosonate 8-phosphate phosphatase KdsC-like HAD superfamily phosphatase
MLRFIVGAIAGGVAVWMWGDELRDYLTERTRGVRIKTADQIQLVQQAAEKITSTLQSGQDAIRPSEDNSGTRPIAR